MRKKLYEKLNQADRIEHSILSIGDEISNDLSGIARFLVLFGLIGANILITLEIYTAASRILVVSFVGYIILIIIEWVIHLVTQNRIDKQFIKKLEIKSKKM